MSVTTRVSLPYIAPQQAQKQVTYNEAMAALDQLVQPAVKGRSVAVPPASPAEGDIYIVAPTATGAWAGKDNRFAAWLSGAWSFRVPGSGWLAYVEDSTELAVFQSGAWAPFVTNGGAAVAKFGINTTADLTSRLAEASAASLFTHAGAGHRMSLNKASAADTVSFLLADNFSGRAEIGLTGDNALHVKVSPNGSSWIEALTIAQASGLISLPAGQLAFPATQNPSANANTLDDYEEGSWTPTIQFLGALAGMAFDAANTKGRYTKIGRQVSATCMVTLTAKGTSTGSAQIAGLPFNALNDGLLTAAAIGWATGMSSIDGAVIGALLPNTGRISLYSSSNGLAAALTNSNFSNTSAIYASVTFDAQ